MEQIKTNLKTNQLWNERFQKSIFDLTDEERAILKREANERKALKRNDLMQNSLDLMNISRRKLNELQEVANQAKVNLIHNSNSNTVKIYGEIESMKKFIRISKISNNPEYLLGMKTSY